MGWRSAADRWLARALGLLFLLAAAFKLRDLGAFEETIARFGIVLDAAVGTTARGLVVAELAVGLGLLLGRHAALQGALALTLLFLAVLGYGRWLGLDVDCGCFGPGEQVSLEEALHRDLVLLLVSGYLYWRRPERRKEGPR
jgi:hypothetical protein